MSEVPALEPTASTEEEDGRARRLALFAPEPESDEGAPPPWLLTFADLMSQLLGLFILLLTFSHFDAGTVAGIKGSIQATFGKEHPTEADPTSPPESPGSEGVASRQMGLLTGLRALERRHSGSATGGNVDVELFEHYDGITLRLSGTAIFDPTEDGIRPAAWPTLDAVAALAAEPGVRLTVESHVPENAAAGRAPLDDLRLAARRAAAIVRYMTGREPGLATASLSIRAGERPVDLAPWLARSRMATRERVDFVFSRSADLPEAPP